MSISISIRQAEYVLGIARWKSMRATAYNLSVSESTISIQVAKLEDELGIALFDRACTCLWITDECKQLLPAFQRMVDARAYVLENARNLKTRRQRQEQQA